MNHNENIRKLKRMKIAKRQLVLNKGAEKFIFRYENGCEDELMDAMIDQVKDTRTSFDWFDACVLSFKLTQNLISQADIYLDKSKIKINNSQMNIN